MSLRRTAGKAVSDQTVDDTVDVIETEMTRLSRTIALLSRSADAPLGLDRAGYVLLRTLERIGPASINAIAMAVGLDGSTVTRQVAAMNRLGLVERTTNPGDRRSCIISPTATGHEAMQDVVLTRRANLASVTSDWSDDDRNMLGRLLARLNDSIARATGCCDPAAQSAG
ncbi:MAG TPA: MarR family winged helix-turn-helix transcriptional regulator [Pseudonocardiaceae bacterium]|nr:MarR family winged helix-turn-helix transcriptional regulator [Pseudonocardiaceae bacterium]